MTTLSLFAILTGSLTTERLRGAGRQRNVSAVQDDDPESLRYIRPGVRDPGLHHGGHGAHPPLHQRHAGRGVHRDRPGTPARHRIHLPVAHPAPSQEEILK